MKTINKGLRQPVITALLSLSLLLLPSCLKGELDELEIWKAENDKWLETTDFSDYEKVAPSWAPQNFIYIKWHNDRKLTEKNLVPMSTSTVNTKYEMEDINGKKLGNSYSVSTGDSVFQTVPNKTITGFGAALTMMHVGDSVTIVIPYNSAYGSKTQGAVQLYTNLIYHTKLKEIVAYEKPL